MPLKKIKTDLRKRKKIEKERKGKEKKGWKNVGRKNRECYWLTYLESRGKLLQLQALLDPE